MNKNKFLIGSMLTISSFVLVSQSAIFAEDESNIKASIENIHNKVASSESTTVRSELKDVLVSEGHQTETFDEKNQDDLNKISDKNDIKNENKDSIINNEDREKLLDSDLKKPKNVSKDKETEFEGNRSSEILAPTTSRESENSLESYLETDTNLSKENLKSTYMNDQNAQILGSTITDSQNLVYKILSYKDGVGTVQLGDGEKSLIWNDDTLRISNVIQNEKGTFTVTEIASNAFYSVIEESSGQRMGPNVSKVIVPNSILKIQDRAFFSAETIRNVEFLPKSNLKHIGKEAFYFSNLKNIIIPDSVETIGDKAFSFNENLTDLEIGDASNLKTIGKGAFSSNKKLKRLYIPKGVTSIGEEAFITTPDLEEIRVSSSNNNFKDIDGILFNKDEKNLIKYPSRKVERNYEIPEKVVFIADYAFDNNDNLKELIFGKNVKKIGDFTFKNADKLEKINLNEGLEEIGRLAFYYMPSLESVELPKSLNSLGRNPFYGLDSLTTIIFGEGVKEFSNSTIAGPLGSLKKIIIKAKNATFAEDSFNLPDNIKGTVKIEVASDNIKNKMVELGFKEENILINLDDDTPDDGTPDEETPDGGTPDEEAPDGGTPDEETPDGGTPDEETPDGGTPDEETPDGGTPDEETPDGGTPDEETPDDGTPDEETPDGGTPDEETPDDGTPDEEAPDGGTPDEEAPDGGTPDEEAPDGGTPDEEAPDGGTSDDSTPSEGTPDDDTPDNDTLADSSPNDGVKNGDESTMVTKSAILSTSLPKTGENDPYLIFSASVLTLLGGLGLYQRSVSKKDNFV